MHGVSGTPPEELLDRPLVEQVAGDMIAGFYMPRLPGERMDSAPSTFAPDRPGAPTLAGYSWDGLTSGSPARALWLILLPFTLMNVAPRSRPAGRDARSRAVRAVWYLARVLALALTCLYVVTGIGVGEDLIGWQCPGGTACTNASPGWVFHDLSYQHRFSAEHMLLLGALIPVAQLLVLWWTSQRTANRYERTVADLGTYRAQVDVEVAYDTNAVELPLSSALMWHNAEQVRRLRAVHMQAGFALVLWTVLGATEPSRDHWYQLSGHWWTLVPIAVLGYALVALAMPSFTGHGVSAAWRIASRTVWVLLAAGGAVQACGLLFVHHWIDGAFLRAVPLPGHTPQREAATVDRVTDGSLPYYPGTVLAVCAVAIVALAALLVVVAASRIADVVAKTNRDPVGVHQPVPIPLLGLAAGAFAALGVFLAAAFSAGTYVFAATWLHTGSVKPGFGQISESYRQFVVPAAVGTANVAYTLAVAVLLALLIGSVVVAAVLYGSAPGNRRQLAQDYPREAARAGDDHARRDKEIRRAMFLGRLVDHAQWFVAAMVLSGLAIVAWFTVGVVQDGGHAPKYVFGTIHKGWLSASSLGGAGAYLAVLTVLGLVALGFLAFRVRATRRVVGILWDVAAFWPRACHPLAAPCYAERTVPDLVTFITAYRVRHPDGALVLAAHSQGTVISAATIRQLATFDAITKTGSRLDVVPQMAFLSFGCVLRRLYGRFFPVYFGPRELHDLEVVLGGGAADDGTPRRPRWRNLWRYTDYLGGQVTDGPPQVVPDDPAALIDPGALPTQPPVRGPVSWEWHSPDPPAFGRRPGDTTYPSAHRHSDFWADESGYFQLAAADLADAVRGAPRDGASAGRDLTTEGRPPWPST